MIDAAPAPGAARSLRPRCRFAVLRRAGIPPARRHDRLEGSPVHEPDFEHRATRRSTDTARAMPRSRVSVPEALASSAAAWRPASKCQFDSPTPIRTDDDKMHACAFRPSQRDYTSAREPESVTHVPGLLSPMFPVVHSQKESLVPSKMAPARQTAPVARVSLVRRFTTAAERTTAGWCHPTMSIDER